MENRFYIKNIGINAVNISDALSFIDQSINSGKTGYVCVTNSRTSYLANKDEEYCEIQNKSLLTVPDGMPLTWIGRNLGHKNVDRVSGPDLMDAIFKISVEKGYSHYFYGSTPNTIEQIQKKLSEQYPGIDMKGAVSPPFQPIENFDIEEISKQVNSLKPTFFWCGLGAPKQERLNALLQPKLDSTICIGVGLAFEYIAGTVKRAPKWIQKSGLEWFYRISQQPKIFKRIIKPFIWIIGQLLLSLFKRPDCQ